jgi:hypothetical protein
MEPILISGTCHILQTDSDINVAEFYKLLDSLGFEDSKTYHLHTNIDVKIMKNITEEIMQEYNAKHVLTLYAGGNSDCEIWYYGKTKINKEDVIMKIDISPAEHTIKLFVTTRSIDTLVRILSEIGGKLQDGLECIGN